MFNQKTQVKVETEDQEENFRMFYQNEYERIDKLETKRENFSNYVITISSLLLVLACNDFEKISNTNSSLLFSFTFLLNIIAIVFISKTRPLVKMHQARANEALRVFSPILEQIKKQFSKPISEGNILRRSLLYSYVHGIIVLVSILMIIKINGWLCP